MTIVSGRVLSGRYRLVKPVGQGAQASVWIADHLALSTQVAVKLIDPELAKQADALERFKREATAAAQLRSAHVVQILDHGVDKAQPFIVMELLEGEDLFERLQTRKRLTLQETSKIVTQVARALTRAHAAGVVHRDLKPENVFLVPNDDDEVAKVLDFGVAKVRDPEKGTMQRTGVGTLIGTPHYMSPEQVKGVAEVDYRTDLWALGVIAYQCLTGQLPFESEGVGDLLIKITIADLPVPSSIVPALPASFDAWFAKICDREPTNRFDSARDAADALAKAVGAEQAAPISAPQETPSMGAANPWQSPGPVSIKEAPNKLVLALQPPEGFAEFETELSGSPRSPLLSIDVEMGDSLHPPPPGPDEAEEDVSAVARPDAGGQHEAKPRPRASAERPAPIVAPPSSTVSGLASSGLSSMPPRELDGSRKRRTLWMIALAFAALAGGVAWLTIRPNLGGATDLASAASPPATPIAVSPVPTGVAVDDPAIAPVGSAVDPGKRSHKPSPPPVAAPAAPKPAPPKHPKPAVPSGAPTSDLPTIDVPEPEEHGPEPKSPGGPPPAPEEP